MKKIMMFLLVTMLAFTGIAGAEEVTGNVSEEVSVKLSDEVVSADTEEITEEKVMVEYPDKGTLELNCECDGVALSGAKISVIKVADASVVNNAIDGSGEATVIYTLIPELSGYSIPDSSGNETFFDGMTALNCIETAEEWAEKGLNAADTGITNKEGVVTFDNLDLGMYLVVQTDRGNISGDYTLFSPYLISVPTASDGQFSYKISCTPKTTAEMIPEPTPPKTGDDFSLWLFIIAGVSIIAIITVGRPADCDEK